MKVIESLSVLNKLKYTPHLKFIEGYVNNAKQVILTDLINKKKYTVYRKCVKLSDRSGGSINVIDEVEFNLKIWLFKFHLNPRVVSKTVECEVWEQQERNPDYTLNFAEAIFYIEQYTKKYKLY